MVSSRPPVSAASGNASTISSISLSRAGAGGLKCQEPVSGSSSTIGSARASEPHVRLICSCARPRGRSRAGVDEVERVRLELAGEEIILGEADVPEPLLGHEPVGGREHRLVDVGPRHLTVGPDPFAQDPQPPEHAATDISARAPRPSPISSSSRRPLAPRRATGAGAARAPRPDRPAGIASFVGLAFDICSAPSSTTGVEYRRGGRRLRLIQPTYAHGLFEAMRPTAQGARAGAAGSPSPPLRPARSNRAWRRRSEGGGEPCAC